MDDIFSDVWETLQDDPWGPLHVIGTKTSADLPRSQVAEDRARTIHSLPDPTDIGQLVVERTVDALRRNFEPVAIPPDRMGRSMRFELVGDLDVEAPPDPRDYEQIARTLSQKGTYGAKVAGTFRLVSTNLAGEETELDRRRVTLARIPTPIFDRSFVVDGKKRHVASQFRRRPGVFSYMDRTGAPVTEFNVDPLTSSKVKRFTVWIDQGAKGADPEFRLNIGGAKKINAVDVAKLLGATESDLKRELGGDTGKSLWAKSTDARYQSTVRELHKVLYKDAARAFDEAVPLSDLESDIRDNFAETRLDSEVVQAVTGLKADQVTKELLINSLGRTTRLANGEMEEDDRESLALKKVMAPWDIVAEGVGRTRELNEFRGKVRSKMQSIRTGMDRGNYKPNVKQVVGDRFDKAVTTKFTTGMLQRSDSATNPLDNMANATLTTIMGEGAIMSDVSVPDDAKLINPSHHGFLDPAHTPESSRAGVNLHLPARARIRFNPSTVTERDTGHSDIVTELLDKNGTYTEMTPAQVKGKVIGALDQYTMRNGKPVATPDEDGKVQALVDGVPRKVRPGEVDVWFPDDLALFDVGSASIPMQNSTQGNRAQYSDKQVQQAVPLLNPELPLVRAAAAGTGRTLDELLGEDAGAVIASFDGTVVKVEDTGNRGRIMEVKDSAGKSHTLKLPKNFPLGGKTPLDSIPRVAAGDKFTRGQVLADSTFTREGSMALGTNLRAAYLPWLGSSVSGDTLMYWVDPAGRGHFAPIREMPATAGVQSGAVDPASLQPKLLPVHAYLGHYTMAEMCEVRTTDNVRVKATTCHSFITVNEDGEFIEIAPRDMVPGETLLPFAQPQVRWATQVETLALSGKTASCVGMNLPLTRDVGWLFGLYVAEGSLLGGRQSEGKGVCFAATEPEIVGKLREVIASLGLTTSAKTRALLVHSTALATVFRETCGRGPQNKRVPDLVWSGTQEFAEGFLDGYWSGDGTISAKQCTATTVSSRLAEGLVFLLAALGVKARYTQHKVPRLGNFAPNLIHVHRECMQNFPALSLPRKHEAVQRLKAKTTQFSRDRIPLPGKHLDTVRGVFRKAGVSVRYGVPYETRQRLLLVYPLLPPVIQRLVDAPLWWEPVQEIVPLPREEYVYDLDMRPYGNFMVGPGLVVHNTFEDSIVVTESAVNKLASLHMYTEAAESPRLQLDKDQYRMRGMPLTREEQDYLDESGVVKVGTRVKPGQVLMVGTQGVEHQSDDLTKAIAQHGYYGKLSKRQVVGKTEPFKHVWNSEYEGEVVDVEPVRKNGKVIGAQVHLRTVEPLRVGDKLYGRHGNKGVVGLIIPESEAPRIKGKVEVVSAGRSSYRVGQEIDEEEAKRVESSDSEFKSKPVFLEIIMNPAGVPGRVNPSQVLETFLGKVAKQTGKPEIVKNFGYTDDDGNWGHTKKRLAAAGVVDADTVFDPATGRDIEGVGNGSQYFFKAKQTVLSKNAARGLGNFQSNGLVSKGDDGAQALGELGVYGLLAQDAREFLRDAQLYKSENRENIWAAMRNGQTLPVVHDEPEAFRRFKNYLRAAGIEPRHEPERSQYVLKPMTDKDVRDLAKTNIGVGKTVENVLSAPWETIRAKDNAPTKGGLFDQNVVGGLSGDRWARFELPTELPNPVFEQAIRDLTGIKAREFDEIMSAVKEVEVNGQTLTGSAAIGAMLKNVDTKELYAKAYKDAQEAKEPGTRSAAYRTLRTIKMLNDNKMSPHAAFMRKQVAVVPANIRPLEVDAAGDFVVADLNYLYRDVAMTAKELDLARRANLPPKALAHLETGLYDTMRTLMQVEGSRPQSSGEYQGILGTLSGKQWSGGEQVGDSKRSMFRNEVVSRRQAFSARAVLSPDEGLQMDEAGVPRSVAAALWELPVESAWKTRNPTHRPEELLQLRKEIQDYHKLGKVSKRVDDLLDSVVENGNKAVVVKRDPVLHKYGVQGFKPRLSRQDTVTLNPLVYGGFSADNDGDSVVGPICYYSVTNPRTEGIDLTQESSMPFTSNSVPLYPHVADISDFPRAEFMHTTPKGTHVYAVPAGVAVPAVNPDGTQGLYPVTEFSIHPDCTLMRVTYASGRELFASSDHSLCTYSPAEGVIAKSPPAESVGRMSPSLSNYSTEGGLPLKYAPLIGCPALDLDYRTGWLLGATIGDGWVSQYPTPSGQTPGRVHLAWGEDGLAVAQEWAEVMARYTDAVARYIAARKDTSANRWGDSNKLTVSSRPVAELFQDLIGTKASGKHLPPWWSLAPFEFRCGLLAGMLDTDGTVTLTKEGEHYDKSRGKSYSRKVGVTLQISTISPLLAEQVVVLAASINIGATCGAPRARDGREDHYVVTLSTPDTVHHPFIKLVYPKKAEALLTARLTVAKTKQDLIPMSPRVKTCVRDFLRAQGACRKPHMRGEAGHIAFNFYAKLSVKGEASENLRTTRVWAEGLQSTYGDLLPLEVQAWLQIVLGSRLSWDRIVSVTEVATGVEMYDLTVPGPYTFAMSNGLYVWDTMAIFAPVTDSANREALEKMTPSNNIFNPSSGGLEYAPGHEAVLGLNRITRTPTKGSGRSFGTTADAQTEYDKQGIRVNEFIYVGDRKTSLGRELVDAALPVGMTLETLIADNVITAADVENGLGAKHVKAVLTHIGKTSPSAFAAAANAFRRVGQEQATYTGASLTMDDLKPIMRPERKAAAKQLQKAIDFAQKSGGTADERERTLKGSFDAVINDLTGKARGEWRTMSQQERPNTVTEMLLSGARAKDSQVQQLNLAPIAMVDGRNKLVPIPVMRNYAEGLDMTGYLTAMHGARMGAVSKVISVQQPGYLSKQVLNTTMDLVITEPDCGTKNGIRLDVNASQATRDLTGRVLAQPVSAGKISFGAAHVLLSNEISEMSRQLPQGEKALIWVRSPTTCEASGGVCQKCAGHDAAGKSRPIGTNIGILAGQAIGERSTQLTLSTFHGGGVYSPSAGSAKDLYGQASSLLRMPSTMGGQAAVIAGGEGTVKEVKQNRAKGGWDIVTEEASSPNFFVPAWNKAPNDSTIEQYHRPGQKIVRGQILSDGVANPRELLEKSGSIRTVQEYMSEQLHKLFGREGVDRKNVETVVRAITGTVEIVEPGGAPLLPGQRVDASMAERLKKTHAGLTYRPILRGVDTAPTENREDWMAALNFNNLKRTIVNRAQIGAVSQYHGTHPIPALAVAAEFNRPRGQQGSRGTY